MSFASRALVLFVVVVACTPMLGLDAVVVDSDRDGIPDEIDVCPFVYDPFQADRNGDGIGDACSECATTTYDHDGDGLDDACDGCIGPGPIGVDADGDGIDDGCDPCVDGVPVSDVDIDRNGKPDACEPCPPTGVDLDQDGVDDACDLCLLGDDHDEDGDGVPNACDVCPADPDPDQQMNADEVDIGKACDPGPHRHVRRLFDGFDRDDDGIWVPSPWFAVADGAVHVSGSGGRRLSFYEVRQQFVVRTFVRFPSPTVRAAVRRVGLEAFSTTSLFTDTLHCSVDRLGNIYIASAGPAVAGGIDVSGGVELRVIRPTVATETPSRCEVIAGGKVVTALIHGLGSEDYNIALTADQDATASYEWIEAIDRTGSP